MKNKLVYFLLLLSMTLFGQTIKATYFHNFLNDKKDSIFSFEEKPFLYSYTYSNKKSIYKLMDSEIEKKDSIKNNDGFYDIIINNSASKNEKFKDLSKKIFYMEYAIFDTNFSVKDNLMNFEWNLLDEELTIKGYKCKKAITNKEKFPIIAWYCEDISINDGPDRFYGLPGFIMKVELGEYSVIEIDQLKLITENLKIDKPINKSKYITIEELKKEESALLQKKKNED